MRILYLEFYVKGINDDDGIMMCNEENQKFYEGDGTLGANDD